MIVKNPTDKEISVQILGTQYTVPANGEREGVKDEHAIHWKEQIHNFLILKNEEVAEVSEETVTEETTKEVINLEGLKRTELDELAEAQGLDSTKYKTAKDIKAALEEVTNE